MTKFLLTYTDDSCPPVAPGTYHDGSRDRHDRELTYVDISSIEELLALCSNVQDADLNVSGLVLALVDRKYEDAGEGVEFSIEVYNGYRE